MLDKEIIRKIEGFVYSKPRSIQEIAEHISKNWRTADRYVDEISEDYGTISTRVFRGGTRGALKIAFYAGVEKISSSVFQQELEKKIFDGRTKFDFSAFDIYQFVDDKQKSCEIEKKKNENLTDLKGLRDILLGTTKQLLIFSGNLSFINLNNKGIDIFKIIEELSVKNVNIKIISRVDLAGKKNIEKMLSLNFKYGNENIEIKHREQPLRAIISDNKMVRIKEISLLTGKENELDENLYFFYTVKDKEWIGWLTKIFHKMYSSSIGAEKRLEELSKIRF